MKETTTDRLVEVIVEEGICPTCHRYHEISKIDGRLIWHEAYSLGRLSKCPGTNLPPMQIRHITMMRVK